MSNHELETCLNNVNIQAYTHNTITDLNELEEQLRQIAQEGVAYDDEECWFGIRSVAAGIQNAEGKTIACVGVLGISSRLTKERIKELAPYVKECAVEISQRLGYRGELKQYQNYKRDVVLDS